MTPALESQVSDHIWSFEELISTLRPHYPTAYQQAASKLVEVFRAKPYYSDAEACPIVFLYRHAIELYLKAILLWGEGLVHLQTG